MAKMLVEDTSLTTVANAIRTKGGTTGALTFPDGFVSAVNGIKTGVSLTPFVNGSITEVTAEMLEGCGSIREGAFRKCTGLKKVRLPSTITRINNNAFGDCTSLSDITLPPNVTWIGSSIFESCPITSMTIPDSVTYMASLIFADCSKLTNVVLSNSCESVPSQMFYNCTSLKSLTIPAVVTSIGGSAFYNCTSFTTLTLKGTTPPTLGSNAFHKCRALTTIKVPKASLSAYKSATNWSAYADLMVGV